MVERGVSALRRSHGYSNSNDRKNYNSKHLLIIPVVDYSNWYNVLKVGGGEWTYLQHQFLIVHYSFQILSLYYKIYIQVTI